MQTWSGECSVVYSTVLSFPPLLGIIQSMNISLITAEKAQQCRAEDACHTPPSARITAPTLHMSPSLLLPFPLFSSLPYPSLVLFSILAFVLFSYLLHFVLSPFFFHVTVSFFSSLSPPTHTHPPHSLLLWMERNFLFTTRITVPALLTNQQEEIFTRDEPGMLVFLTARHVSLSHVCMCVRACGCVCVAHVLLPCQTGDCCDMSPSFVTLEDKTVSLGPHVPKYMLLLWFQTWYLKVKMT